MHEEVLTVVEKTKVTHKFFCDECGCFIDESEEYEDGWYPCDCCREWKIFIDGRWYYKKAELCDDCTNKVTNNIINALEKLGFTDDMEEE